MSIKLHQIRKKKKKRWKCVNNSSENSFCGFCCCIKVRMKTHKELCDEKR